jgi:hypothetical protein
VPVSLIKRGLPYSVEGTVAVLEVPVSITVIGYAV